MLELFEQDRQEDGRKSSKGNQLKWIKNNIWYKADYTGYEGLAEYMVSHLLRYSNLAPEAYVLYDTETFRYRSTELKGCKSRNFLPAGCQLITAERLFQARYGQSLYTSVWQIRDEKERAKYLVSQLERLTGIAEIGKVLTAWITIDAFFLNEDRHTHNIAFILHPSGKFAPSPAFDHGASLLSDTMLDYPMTEDIYTILDKAKAKTFSSDFDIQLDCMEELVGQQIRFSFTRRDVTQLLEAETVYPEDVKARVRDIIFYQMRKYQYLFP